MQGYLGAEPMAEWLIEGDELVLHLSLLGKVVALHRDVRVPLDAVSEVADEPDPWMHLRGIRSPGKVLPALIAYGTRRHRGGRDFAAIQGTGPAVRVDLKPATKYTRLMATVSDHHSSLERISEAVRRVRNP